MFWERINQIEGILQIEGHRGIYREIQPRFWYVIRSWMWYLQFGFLTAVNLSISIWNFLVQTNAIPDVLSQTFFFFRMKWASLRKMRARQLTKKYADKIE